MDKKGFCIEILALRNEFKDKININDLNSFKKLIWFNRFIFLLGSSLAWWYPNPVSMLCFSLYFMSNWCTIAHHTLHGSFDSLAGINKKYSSKYFAVGWRRFLHWNDWILPKAWSYEHNVLHHYHTNEPLDPDRVADNVKYGFIKNRSIRKLLLFSYITLWKPIYYVLNTMKAEKLKKSYSVEGKLLNYLVPAIFQCYLPYIFINFILFPLCFIGFGWQSVLFVFINRFGAEILTNIHSFLVIVPNHTGDDIELFEDHFDSKEEFFYRQVVTACNYKSNSKYQDYLFGYLNFQIEHHLFPNFPPSQYRAISYRVRQLCAKYDIPYQESSINYRVKSMVNVALNC